MNRNLIILIVIGVIIAILFGIPAALWYVVGILLSQII